MSGGVTNNKVNKSHNCDYFRVNNGVARYIVQYTVQ